MPDTSPLEAGVHVTSPSEDNELPIEPHDLNQENYVVDGDAPSVTPQASPNSIEDGASCGSVGLDTSPSDHNADLNHVDGDQVPQVAHPLPRLVDAVSVVPPCEALASNSTTASHQPLSQGHNEKALVAHDMQLVHVPKPSNEKALVAHDMQLVHVPKPSHYSMPREVCDWSDEDEQDSLLELPSGIVFLNGKWIQLGSARKKASSSDGEAREAEKEAEPKTHNPFDSSDSEESSQASDNSDDEERSSEYSSRYSNTSTRDFPKPSTHFSPKLNLDESGSAAESSLAAAEWRRQKQVLGEKNKALDHLMAMEGIEEVKREFLKVKAKIEEARKRKGWLRRQDMNMVLMGNSGTGKRTIAALYRDFLVQCGVWPNVKRRGVESLKVAGVNVRADDLDRWLRYSNDGAFFLIDAVEQTDPDEVAKLFEFLEQKAKSTVVVLTGSTDGVTTFLGSKPHGRWLFWRRLFLKDYDDNELHRILLGLIRHNSLTVDGDDENPYTLIAAKRVGRGRDSAGFGNVHDLASSFEKMLDRQSLRLKKEHIRTLKDHEHVRTDEDADNDKVDGTDEQDEEKDKTQAHAEIAEQQSEDQMLEDNISGSDNVDTQLSSTEEIDPGKEKGLLTMDDIIGPEPVDIRTQSSAWKKLEKMVGLESVKKAIGELVVRAKANYRREIQGQEPLKTSLNRVFMGPPGTGKSTVAKLYGQILADIGVLTTQEVVVKTPADFIGEFIGESEVKTGQILDSTLGKVLIIDDAHMFYSTSRAGSTSKVDSFRLGCVDVLISRIHNRPGEDRCVILIGYPDMMEEMFQNVNPGLRRRFPIEEAFRFEDYDDERLNAILRLKMAEEGIKSETQAMDVAAEVLRRARDRPNFGNGGDVDNLLNQAKGRFRERWRLEKKKKTRNVGDDSNDTGVTRKPSEPTDAEENDGGDSLLDDLLDDHGPTEVVLEREDFDPEWDRGSRASKKCRELFDGLIGFEGIIDKFQGFQKTAANMRLNNKDPRESIPFTYIFKGPPGTGKTHTARILGQIFYDMGFLSTNEVIECSASHLIGQFMGQTAPKVISLFDRALGKVLFIDEAYRLAGGGRFSRGTFEDEAIGELVDCMTKKKFHKKMIIVLAGYDRDMDALMKTNAGLQGRFATEIVFPSMNARRSREHLFNLIAKEDIEVWDEVPATIEMKEKVLRLFDKLGMTAGWANGRDVKTLAASITARVYNTANELMDMSAEGQHEEKQSKTGNKADGKLMENEQGMKRLKFRISTKDLTEFLKDMLRQRIKGGRAK